MTVAKPPLGLNAHPSTKNAPEDFQKAYHIGRYAASIGRKVTTNPYVDKETRQHWQNGWAHETKHGTRDDAISNATRHLQHQGFAMRNHNTRLDAAQESLDKLHEHVSELENRADAIGMPRGLPVHPEHHDTLLQNDWQFKGNKSGKSIYHHHDHNPTEQHIKTSPPGSKETWVHYSHGKPTASGIGSRTKLQQHLLKY